MHQKAESQKVFVSAEELTGKIAVKPVNSVNQWWLMLGANPSQHSLYVV